MGNKDYLIPRQNTSLRAMVENRLRDAVITGDFQPGQRLVERELCELFGVGRTSIREALRQLEAEGLVTSVPHKGPTVSRVDLEEAEQLYAARIQLESYMGQQFAEKGTDEDMRRLTLAFEHFEKAAVNLDRSELLLAKTAFYDVLMDGCHNIFIKQMLSLLHNRVNLLRMMSMTQPSRLHHSIAEVREIHEAIISRNGERASSACRRHIEEAAKTALELLKITNQSSAF